MKSYLVAALMLVCLVSLAAREVRNMASPIKAVNVALVKNLK